MTNDQYLAVQTQLQVLAGLVADMPLEDFLERIHLAEAVGPMLDPTLYRAAHRNLEAINGLAVALMGFKKTVLKVRNQQ